MFKELVDLSLYIELRDERPYIRGRRLPISMIVSMAKEQSSSITDLAYQFSISVEQVLAALLYYKEHQALIDAQDAEDQSTWDELRRTYGKPSSQ